MLTELVREDVVTVVGRPATPNDPVLAVVRSLDPLDQEVVVLRYGELMTLEDVARCTESTTGRVLQRLRRVAVATADEVAHDAGAAPQMLTARDEDEAVEDLRIGITPQMAWRLRRAAASGELVAPARVRAHRHQLLTLAWLHRHAVGLLGVVAAAGGVVLTVVAAGGPA